ncbi:PrsW family glutamic-type intramembrane protease [Paenibacillus sp. CC-CFT747]|nr:PrsW family glutamic-type intramembrane protease [Paenibacillus sp. CC-CFT747]
MGNGKSMEDPNKDPRYSGSRLSSDAGSASAASWLKTVYTVWCWISLLFFIVCLFLFRDSRTMLVQYLWSFYVMLQFWFLCRSKTFTWKQAGLFMLLGVFLVIPLTALTLLAAHGIFGGNTRDTWSQAVLTPIAEEVWKLLPLGLFLFFSRRASSMSLADYTLAGAGAGVGFQLMEELTRRWLNSGIIGRTYGYSTTLLGGETIHWDFWTLFPGRFEESLFPTVMSVSHPVHTGMVALGLGLAVRYRRQWGKKPSCCRDCSWPGRSWITWAITARIPCRTGS